MNGSGWVRKGFGLNTAHKLTTQRRISVHSIHTAKAQDELFFDNTLNLLIVACGIFFLIDPVFYVHKCSISIIYPAVPGNPCNNFKR